LPQSIAQTEREQTNFDDRNCRIRKLSIFGVVPSVLGGWTHRRRDQLGGNPKCAHIKLLSQPTGYPMVQKLAIALATVSAITLGSTLSASAMHGGAGAFHGGFAHPGYASSGFAHPGFRDHFAFRHHRFFRDRFFFAGGPFYYDDACIERVWTHWGWRWVNICY
jgi:hypothetical protein